MDRLQLLHKSIQLAHESVDGVAALSDANYERIMNDFDNPVSQLAKEILEEAEELL